MNILVIDDDKIIRKIIPEIIKPLKHKIFTAEDGYKGLELLKDKEFDICFLDLWMPRIGGIEILKEIREKYPSIYVVMISGQASVNIAVKATKLGAFDFIEKPFSDNNLIAVIKSIEISKKEKNTYSKHDLSQNDILIGNSQPIINIKKLIESAAKSDARILITGENGTGKELIAREIHTKSLRMNKPFVEVNCAAIPENLIESELFGHVKGSFTGATDETAGKFQAADTGTLFLDEVADMSLTTQAKVLRVLQEMQLTKIGSSESIKIDVRIIAATNKDIKNEIKNESFREDLYYRLNVVPISVPSLRERVEDIPLLVNYFIKKLSRKNKTELKKIEDKALKYMQDYSWPGNVRQLRNIIERLNVMVTSKTISLDDVKKYLDIEGIQSIEGIINKYQNYKLNVARDEFEKDFIEEKLIENKFNISKTAKALGVYSSNLHSKINKLGINIKKLKNMYYNK